MASAFSRTLFFGRLFVGGPTLHLAEDSLALHFLFEEFQRLFDVVVADQNLQNISNLRLAGRGRGAQSIVAARVSPYQRSLGRRHYSTGRRRYRNNMDEGRVRLGGAPVLRRPDRGPTQRDAARRSGPRQAASRSSGITGGKLTFAVSGRWSDDCRASGVS